MQARVLIIAALLLGVITLVCLTGRKPADSTKMSVAVAGPPPITRPLFAKTAPATTVADSADSPARVNTTNLFQLLMSGEDVDLQLSAEQWAAYLRQYGTNVETLLATQRTNYIQLAAEMFPDDPRVQYAVLARDVFPEVRRQWLDAFKQSAPDNAVADYLSARDYLKAGDRENALKDLANAAGKSRFDDYSLGQVQDMEDAQLSAGRSLLESKVAANSGILLPQMVMFKNIAQEIQTMQKGIHRRGRHRFRRKPCATWTCPWPTASSRRRLPNRSRPTRWHFR